MMLMDLVLGSLSPGLENGVLRNDRFARGSKGGLRCVGWTMLALATVVCRLTALIVGRFANVKSGVRHR